LFDAAGDRVMAGVHPLEDLAPRDVVANAISSRMAQAPGGVDDHVFLDATHMGVRFYERFPSITAACREIGIDPAVDRIPVAPAEHYACGGIPADLDGVTGLPGFYAVGEVTCTGVHGANRLASNSLTESVVAGTRVGRDLAWELPERVEPDLMHDHAVVGALIDPNRIREARAVMSRHVGVIRDEMSLATAAGALGAIARDLPMTTAPSRRSREGTNVLTVAAAVVAAAQQRTESRGCHRRTDFPAPDDRWLTHLDVTLDAVGSLDVTGGPDA
jgi:L-aspartate oxidase